MNYYLVPLYEVELEVNSKNRGKIKFLDNIVIQKDDYYGNCVDVVTEANFAISPAWHFEENNQNKLRREYWDTGKYYECNHRLLIRYEDIVEKNKANKEQVSLYIEQYEQSTWRQVHDDIITTIGKQYIKNKLN